MSSINMLLQFFTKTGNQIAKETGFSHFRRDKNVDTEKKLSNWLYLSIFCHLIIYPEVLILARLLIDGHGREYLAGILRGKNDQSRMVPPFSITNTYSVRYPFLTIARLGRCCSCSSISLTIEAGRLFHHFLLSSCMPDKPSNSFIVKGIGWWVN